MTKKIDIYWTYKEVEHTGWAEYVKDDDDDVFGNTCEDYINFVSDEGCVTVDHVEQEDCDPGITLDMIWDDLLSRVDDDGRLDITDIQLV